MPVDECANAVCATARCRPKTEADNRVVAEGEDGYLNGTTGLPVGFHHSHVDRNGFQGNKTICIGFGPENKLKAIFVKAAVNIFFRIPGL